jgi:hypothetical protein
VATTNNLLGKNPNVNLNLAKETNRLTLKMRCWKVATILKSTILVLQNAKKVTHATLKHTLVLLMDLLGKIWTANHNHATRLQIPQMEKQLQTAPKPSNRVPRAHLRAMLVTR